MTYDAILSDLQGIPSAEEVRDRLRLFMRCGLSARKANNLYVHWVLRHQRNGARIVREILEERRP